MPAGLQGALGLSEPQQGGSDAQANAFRAAFQAAMGAVTGALEWTATKAEQAKHDPEASASASMFEQYQSAACQIDPTNPAAAQAAIDTVLAAAKTLGGTATAMKDAVEKALDAWTAEESVFEEAVGQVDEVVEWFGETASDLLDKVKGVNDSVAERAWEAAKDGFGALKDAVGPLYEKFVKEKAAQDEYDTEQPPFAEAFEAVKQAAAELPGVAADLLAEVAQKVSEMTTQTEEKEFTGALGILRGLNLDKIKEMLETEKAAKDQYEMHLPDITARVQAVQYPVIAMLPSGTTLEPPPAPPVTKEQIDGCFAQMQAEAAKPTWVVAVGTMERLEGLLTQWESAMPEPCGGPESGGGAGGGGAAGGGAAGGGAAGGGAAGGGAAGGGAAGGGTAGGGTAGGGAAGGGAAGGGAGGSAGGGAAGGGESGGEEAPWGEGGDGEIPSLDDSGGSGGGGLLGGIMDAVRKAANSGGSDESLADGAKEAWDSLEAEKGGGSSGGGSGGSNDPETSTSPAEGGGDQQTENQVEQSPNTSNERNPFE